MEPFKRLLLINNNMGMKIRIFISIVALAIWFLATSASKPQINQNPQKGLKDYYASYFSIGVAVSPRALKTDEAQLVRAQFNSVTAENAMKVGPIHPEENKFNWAPADEIVAFAQANGMKMRGHTLCWHNQLPKWIFVDQKGDTVSKEVLLNRLKTHITEVVTRYKGKIYAWDV
ncbi:MAG TPA: endo-1,4-beta-xylanase, partial [Cyclobacteriaceae bacterium]|nr:endo-1,4-beta-xylanase [Cyclobacteriaceae bacterium]